MRGLLRRLVLLRVKFLSAVRFCVKEILLKEERAKGGFVFINAI